MRPNSVALCQNHSSARNSLASTIEGLYSDFFMYMHVIRVIAEHQEHDWYPAGRSERDEIRQNPIFNSKQRLS